MGALGDVFGPAGTWPDVWTSYPRRRALERLSPRLWAARCLALRRRVASDLFWRYLGLSLRLVLVLRPVAMGHSLR